MMKKLVIIFLVISFFLMGATTINAEQLELDFAIHTEPGTPAHKAAIKFKEIVEDKSNDSIKVRLFPGAALGGEKDNIEQLKTGDVTFAIFGDILPSVLAPKVSPTVVPFIYPDMQSVYDAWDSELGDLMKEKIEERGNMMVIGLQRRGARHLTSNEVIESPADLKGQKLRVPEIPSWVKVWQGIGAKPTPVAWPEVYSALQTGVVDGQENPYSNIKSAKLYEVQDYVMETSHLQNVFHWAMSLTRYKELTPYQQMIILNAAQKATEYGSQIVKEEQESYKQDLIDQGMEVIEVDQSLFREEAKPVIKEMIKEEWNPEVWEHIKKYFN